MECVFCKIIAGKLPAKLIYQDDQLVAFRDINPQAKVHILLVPRKHLASLNEARSNDQKMLGNLLLVAQRIAQKQGVLQRGYRLVINTGQDSGQVVEHLHMHLLGGETIR